MLLLWIASLSGAPVIVGFNPIWAVNTNSVLASPTAPPR